MNTLEQANRSSAPSPNAGSIIGSRNVEALQDGQGFAVDGESTFHPEMEAPKSGLSARSAVSLREIRQVAEREAITEALRECNGQVPAAAAVLGISRAQLYRLIGRLQLKPRQVAGMSSRLDR